MNLNDIEIFEPYAIGSQSTIKSSKKGYIIGVDHYSRDVKYGIHIDNQSITIDKSKRRSVGVALEKNGKWYAQTVSPSQVLMPWHDFKKFGGDFEARDPKKEKQARYLRRRLFESYKRDLLRYGGINKGCSMHYFNGSAMGLLLDENGLSKILRQLKRLDKLEG